MFALKLICLQLACVTIGMAHYRGSVSGYGNAAAELPAGYIRYENARTAYKIHENNLNWDHARLACHSEGARLAIIDNSEKLHFVQNMRPWLSWVWVGISWDTPSRDWKGADGASISSNLPWALLNPNLTGNCVAISGLITGLSNWGCGGTRMYVCEIPDSL